MRDGLRWLGRCLGECSSLMVGLPDYDRYVAHLAARHPEQAPLTFEAFFRDRQDARFGAGNKAGFRCC